MVPYLEGNAARETLEALLKSENNVFGKYDVIMTSKIAIFVPF